MASETDMWLESQIYGPQKQIRGWRASYMAPRNRYVAGEPDIGSQKQICGWRARYMALRNRSVAGESDIGPQKQICGRRVRYRASETDMWPLSQKHIHM